MINRKLCKHEHVKTILTPELVHYGKKVCEDCGKFLGWVSDPDPNKLSHKKKCEMVIPVLEKYAESSNSKFFQSIISQWNNRHDLSPKQLECVIGNIIPELKEAYGIDILKKLEWNNH